MRSFTALVLIALIGTSMVYAAGWTGTWSVTSTTPSSCCGINGFNSTLSSDSTSLTTSTAYASDQYCTQAQLNGITKDGTCMVSSTNSNSATCYALVMNQNISVALTLAGDKLAMVASSGCTYSLSRSSAQALFVSFSGIIAFIAAFFL